MKALRQILVFLLVLAGGAYLLITYVPAARCYAVQSGLPELLGIELEPAAAPEPGARRNWGGGGPILVVAEPLREEIQADRITALGDGRAKRAVTVRANAVGQLTSLSLPAGERIEAGRVIATLEDEAEQIALQTAQLQLENARAERSRVARLEGTGAVTGVRLRETDLALRRAELALRQAEFDLAQRRILAPITGWAGISDLEVGDRVSAQDALTTLTDRSEIMIDFRLPERVVAKLEVGQEITVTPLALRDRQIKGTIAAIDSVIDRDSRTLRVRGRVPNREDLLRAGMAFSVALEFPGARLLSVPPLAVQWRDAGPYVWKVEDGRAKQVDVELVQRNSASVLLRADGLREGDLIVTEGVQSLREGAEVRVTNEAGSAQRSPTERDTL